MPNAFLFNDCFKIVKYQRLKIQGLNAKNHCLQRRFYNLELDVLNVNSQVDKNV